MAYDPINRMTDPTTRKNDDTRVSDHAQVLGNQEHADTQFGLGHSAVDGGHATQHVTDMFGYADRVGLGVNPVPLAANDVQLHLMHPTTQAVVVGFFQRLDVGASLTGIYEEQVAFGGDRVWCGYAAVERTGTE